MAHDKAVADRADHATRRLAIIGCGSSGLITLKSALDELPDWHIVCFERTAEITGVWGHPYPGFVSTSTKYTTQFACFPEREADAAADGGRSREEFFRDGEYGEYLNRFADAFQLRKHIKLGHQVVRLRRDTDDNVWLVTYRSLGEPGSDVIEHFDAVVICTGLTAQVKEIETAVPKLSGRELNALGGVENCRGERIVVFGGGESAVDYARRLSRPELDNEVYLSLRSGVRVSPRYHPIRGVPSDFLRNRLMLSIHPTLRNWIGQRFVAARMRHEARFQKWFPADSSRSTAPTQSDEQFLAVRKEWACRLTRSAKDELFNMFHNKSDDFLDAVARGRITVVGAPVDGGMRRFHQFDSDDQIDIAPTKVVPAVGYRSNLAAIAGESLRLTDFYLGCIHLRRANLFLVGFARPVIGNVPSISEMQAAYVVGLIGGDYSPPARIVEQHATIQEANRERFPTLDHEVVFPVEMFPYCDYLARQMRTYPSLWKIGSLREWWRLQLAPATTAHYFYDDDRTRRFFAAAPVYMPPLLVMLLLLLKPLDWIFRAVRRLGRRPAAHLPS